MTDNPSQYLLASGVYYPDAKDDFVKEYNECVVKYLVNGLNDFTQELAIKLANSDFKGKQEQVKAFNYTIARLKEKEMSPLMKDLKRLLNEPEEVIEEEEEEFEDYHYEHLNQKWKWIAIDENGNVNLFTHKPIRQLSKWFVSSGSIMRFKGEYNPPATWNESLINFRPIDLEWPVNDDYKWWACDSDGIGYFFKNEPQMKDNFWHGDYAHGFALQYNSLLSSVWKLTKTKRPNTVITYSP